MGDENPPRTLRDYSRPTHEGYRNTIELPDGNNEVPLRFDTIRLVQNGCSFQGLWSEDPNQHLKDFLKIVDSLDLKLKIGKECDYVYFNFSFAITLAIGLNIFPRDPSLLGRISLLNDPRDFAKLVKAISLPHDIPNASDRRLIELEKQVQRLMEAHLAPKASVQVNKIASSCEICSGPHDTQYCMENLEQAFVDYASSCTDEAK
ncbi:hypothetical protein Tco_1484760 [Tanacetum coccineum]